jgi:CheY-like chemotaxis protein
MFSYNEIEILLIEDNPHEAQLTLLAISKTGFTDKVYWAETGEEALDFLFARGKFNVHNLENQPKIIILDLKLPRLDGLQVLKQIKSDARTANIVTIVLSSSNQENDISQSYEAGVNKYIQKPIKFDDFVEVLRQELGEYWKLFGK